MRNDALGLFWQDEPIIKKVAEKVKVEPPEPTWLSPDYLPGLEEARRFPVPLYNDETLIEDSLYHITNRGQQHPLLFDIEIYANYFLVVFRSYINGNVIYFEYRDGETLSEQDVGRLQWILDNFCLVSFNGINFDMPILALAMAGKSTAQLKRATEMIINEGFRPRDVLRHFKVKALQADHIDIMEVAPLSASLKIYGGRVHVPRMQDLPFPPGIVLSENQISIVRWYCVNDTTSTGFLMAKLKEPLELRARMSNEYGVDLRSKSDAQIAETVIGREVEKLTGVRCQRPTIDPGTTYYYRVPHYLQYQSELMRWVLDKVARTPFVVNEYGKVPVPQSLTELKIRIGESEYQMGNGGLHSCEKKAWYVEDDEYIICDWDVASYYPRIILNQGLYPQHLGPQFLRVYNSIVERRLEAKRAGDKSTAGSLKITINGSFGKLGSRYSILYAPDLLIQTTVTGQLSLLLLIERMEMAGIQVVSGNTDGIVIRCKRSQEALMTAICDQWQQDCQFELERTDYKAIYSRDVNNYTAFKHNGEVKIKGFMGDQWGEFRESETKCLEKNPANPICIEAAIRFLRDGIPLETTIYNCKDITRFVTVRTVNGGGAVKLWYNPANKDKEEPLYPNQFLGKAIRWYYAKDVPGYIVYANSGKKVPRSDGAMPLMQLPGKFPDNVDHGWYVAEAESIVAQLGATG